MYKDKYYTNGFFISYCWSGKDTTTRKKIHTLQAGQKIFTPYNYGLREEASIDRPYAGFLFLSYKQTHALKNDALFQWSLAAGTTGKASLAGATQEWYHRALKIKTPRGWDYQLSGELGANITGMYTATLFSTRRIAFKPTVEATVGNIFINATARGTLQLGLFEKNSESILWNTAVSNGKTNKQNKYELFLYYTPQIILQGYNATVQGAMFSHNTHLHYFYSQPVIYQQSFGGTYSGKRAFIKTGVVQQTKEAKSQLINHLYGSIEMGWRF